MGRRPPQSKRRVPEDGQQRPMVPPPWAAMEPEEEDRARRIYEALRARAGGPPVVRAGERPWDVRAAIGALPVSLWWAARFDPDEEFRRRALVAAVDHVRAQVVEHVRWLERAPAAEADGPGDGFSRFGISDGCDYVRRARSTDPLGGLSDHGGDPLGARAVLADLVDDAATVGLLVTETGAVQR